jgi:hypothetical protein
MFTPQDGSGAGSGCRVRHSPPQQLLGAPPPKTCLESLSSRSFSIDLLERSVIWIFDIVKLLHLFGHNDSFLLIGYRCLIYAEYLKFAISSFVDGGTGIFWCGWRRAAANGFALEQPSIQVFEKKPKAEAAPPQE